MIPRATWITGDLDGYAVELDHRPDEPVPWGARLRAIPGCMAQGQTRDEALSRLASIWPRYRDRMNEFGVVLPAPDGPSATIEYVWIPGKSLGLVSGEDAE